MCAFQENLQRAAKLFPRVNLIFPKSEHNLGVEEYSEKAFVLKAKCRKRVNSSRDNLRGIFNDVTRTDPSAHYFCLG